MTRRGRLLRGAALALAMVAVGGGVGVALATVVMTRQGSPERLRARTGTLAPGTLLPAQSAATSAMHMPRRSEGAETRERGAETHELDPPTGARLRAGHVDSLSSRAV